MMACILPSSYIMAYQEQTIPSWIRNVALWWGEGKITDSEFLSAIKYLIDNGVLVVSEYDPNEKNYLDQFSSEESEKSGTKFNEKTPERAELESMARTNPLIKGLISGQLKFYIEPTPKYAASNVDFEVNRISGELEKRSITEMKFQRVYDINDADIQISWIKNYGSHAEKVGLTTFKSVITVGLGADNCYGEWTPFDTNTVSKILWHEIGHSLGFSHSSDPQNIMYYSVDPRFEIDQQNFLTLDKGKFVVIPFCKQGTIFYKVSSESQSTGFKIFVIPETQDLNNLQLDKLKFYKNCSSTENVILFSRQCEITTNDRLLIYNPAEQSTSKQIEINVEIIDANERLIPDYEWDMEAFEYDLYWLDEIWSMYH